MRASVAVTNDTSILLLHEEKESYRRVETEAAVEQGVPADTLMVTISEHKAGVIKIITQNHLYLGVNNAGSRNIEALYMELPALSTSLTEEQRRSWHTIDPATDGVIALRVVLRILQI